MSIILRLAKQADAEAVATVYLASRKAFIAFAPLAHTDDQVRHWVTHVLIASGEVTVALVGEEIVGMIATAQHDGFGWIDQLYIAPEFVGRGIGSRMLAHAKAVLTPPIRLYTFQENLRARRFYERHGFQAAAFSDGQDNEEQCPDILYQWDGSTGNGQSDAHD